MDLKAVEKVYRLYAPRYDLYFGGVFQPGRRAVIHQMDCKPGDRILEVGVGTGLSLPLYRRDVRVTGIDISPEMLARAEERKREQQLDHVTLQHMNAEHMKLADDSFDKVVAMYVVSVTPDPVALVDEMRRVCRPDGGLYIVNHFRSDALIVSALERLVAPFSRMMGFKPDLALGEFIAGARLDIAKKVRVNLFGYWTLLCARNNKERLQASSRP